MTLKVSKTSDLKNNLIVKTLISGRAKVGKTTLATTVPLTTDAHLYYISVDPGAIRLRDRSFTQLSAEHGRWNRKVLDDIYEHVFKSADAGNVEHVFVDGVDELAEAVLKETKSENKNGMKAYGEMNDYVGDWLKSVRDIGSISSTFVTHQETIKDQETGAITSIIPAIPGQKLKNKLNELFDIIASMQFINFGDGVTKRMLICRPDYDPRYEVGDRTGALNDLEEPDLGKIYEKIKGSGFKVSDDTPRQVTEQELNALPAFFKEHGVTKEKLASALNGRSIRDFNINELNQLKDLLKEKKG